MTKKLRIGFVIDDNLDSTAGVQQFTLTLGRELAKRGHTVRYLTSSTSSAHTDSKSIYSLSKTVYARMNGNKVGTPLPASAAEIQRILQKEQFDVLHVTTPYSPLLAGRVIMRSKAALVGTFHIAVDTPVAGIGARLLALVQTRSLKRFHFWTAASAAAEQFAKQYYRIQPEKITSNPIELKAFAKPEVPKKYHSDKLVIAFLGRLVERKGAQHLLRAVAALDEQTRAAIEVRIGGGGQLQPKLEAYVADNQLEDTVRFSGFVPENDKAAFLAAADICAFPSTGGECFGISLVEGMAVGSSVVVGGDNQGYRTVLGSGKGVLVDPEDTAAFSARLSALIHDTQEREAIIDWQNKQVKQYDVPIIANQMERVYLEAIRRNQKSS